MPENLTDSFVRHHKNPDKLIEIFDEGVTGLSIRITPAGHKTWYFRYRFGGKVRRYKIGKYPIIKLAKARDIAKDLYVKVHQGIDPNQEKKNRISKVPDKSFRELAEAYKSIRLPSLREKTRQEHTRIIDNELIPAIGNVPAKELDRGQIISLLDKKAIVEGKKTMANRIRARLHSIFEFGISRDIVQVNPVAGTKPYQDGENKRDRFYSEDEIRALWKAFEQQDEPAASIFKMLLICGQRSTETRYMKWENIKGKVWTIPASLSKSKREHAVPIPSLALQIINDLKGNDTEYVFESLRSPGQPLQGLKRPKESVRLISGVKDFRPHDLRRTATTYMAELNINRTVLGKVLNHKGIAGDDLVTAIYDRHEYLAEMREALERWSQRLVSILDSKPGEAKITNIR